MTRLRVSEVDGQVHAHSRGTPLLQRRACLPLISRETLQTGAATPRFSAAMPLPVDVGNGICFCRKEGHLDPTHDVPLM
jgi:hypothetical protein